MSAQHFVDFMQQLARGAVLEELGEHLETLVEAVEDTGKSGKLTVTFDLKPRKSMGDSTDQVDVGCDIKVTIPRADRARSLLFITGSGGLSRQDPNQPELPLRPVTDERKEAVNG